jgi:hypothetical protein
MRRFWTAALEHANFRLIEGDFLDMEKLSTAIPGVEIENRKGS